MPFTSLLPCATCPRPRPAAGEILVRLHAAALNHRDVFIQEGKYAGIKLPCTLGADGAGEVAAHGPGVPADAPAVGGRVLVNPGLRWGDNPRVQAADFVVLGMPDPGTFAEYITLPAHYIRPLPAHLSFEQGAALPLAGLTAYRAAFTRAQVQPGERVLVTGVGGGRGPHGRAAVRRPRGRGLGDVQLRRENCPRSGRRGPGRHRYNAENWVKTLIKQAGGAFDVIIDSAGGAAFGPLLDAAAPGGRIVFFGGTLGNITDIPPGKVFWKQLSILGSTMGTAQDFEDMLAARDRKKHRARGRRSVSPGRRRSCAAPPGSRRAVRQNGAENSGVTAPHNFDETGLVITDYQPCYFFAIRGG